MTMTDTEAKALALVKRALDYADRQICRHEDTHRGGAIWTICSHCDQKWADDDGGFKPSSWPEIFDEAMAELQAQAATEARHAAELRELKERFSEAVCEWRDADTPVKAAKAAARLHDFILPAPDPLVEVIAAALREASPFADDGHDYTAEAKVAAAAVRAHQKDTSV